MRALIIGFILLLVLLANIFVHIFLPSDELLGKLATNLNHSCSLPWSIFIYLFIIIFFLRGCTDSKGQINSNGDPCDFS